MLKFIVGIFFLLHGLVHLLYYAQSRRYFELQPGLTWPDGSWAFSKLLGDEGNRWLAGIACILAAIAFVAGGIGLLVGQSWWRTLIVGAAVFSSAIYILFWDGMRHRLDAQGGVAILINIVILATVRLTSWLDF